MPWTSTEVICRAEGRADQRPLKFRWQGGWLEVRVVETERLERGPAEGDPTFRVFEVSTARGPFMLRAREPGWSWQCRMIPVAPDPCL